jgi:hypothetical protein
VHVPITALKPIKKTPSYHAPKRKGKPLPVVLKANKAFSPRKGHLAPEGRFPSKKLRPWPLRTNAIEKNTGGPSSPRKNVPCNGAETPDPLIAINEIPAFENLVGGPAVSNQKDSQQKSLACSGKRPH